MKRSLSTLALVAALVVPVIASAQDANQADSRAIEPAAAVEGQVAGSKQPPVETQWAWQTSRLSPASAVWPAAPSAPLAPADSGLMDTLFGTQKRAGNTMLIGGATLAAVGLIAVKGNAGAAMGVAGMFSCIFGLYLHYR